MFEKKLHFLIFERFTEEESVLTLAKLLSECGFLVSVFLSKKIFNLIESDLNSIGIFNTNIIDDKKELIQNINDISCFIKQYNVDLTFITSFSSVKLSEIFPNLKLLKNNKICVLVENYDFWFSRVPVIKFNGWKLIKLSYVKAWLVCRISFPYFHSYFVSEIHTNSTNPLKKEISRKTTKVILDIPFKVMDSQYRPLIKYNYPIFVIPGSIDRQRRDYELILDILENPEYKKYNWELILLGRPKGKYGNVIINKCLKINKVYGENRINYFEKYVDKNLFDKIIYDATHIIAPVRKNEYKYGKDSGALYDVFKYNKLGIFDNSYFYDDALPEKNVLISYKNQTELEGIIAKIIKSEYDYTSLQLNFDKINKLFNKNNYREYLCTTLNTLAL